MLTLLGNNLGEETDDFVAEEVLVADEGDDSGEREYFAEGLEACGSDFIEGHV